MHEDTWYASSPDHAMVRRCVYGLLITVTVGLTIARIVGVERVFEPSTPNPAVWPKDRPDKFPTFSSNDRSRWSTVRTLVENKTFVVGERIIVDRDAVALVVGGAGAAPIKPYLDEGMAFTDGYKSVDYVKHPETNKFYSTKPPLFTALVAGEYLALNKGLGWTLAEPRHRWPVVCIILITFNVLPLMIVLLLLANLIEEYGTTDWGRLFVFASACFGTFLTTFAVTLNNHTPAACCVLIAVYPLLRGRASESHDPFTPMQLLVSGFFAGLAVCFDLPAAAFTAALAFMVFLKTPARLIWFVLAALIPIGALLAMNYSIFDTLVPVYSKKDTEWYKYEGSHWLKLDQKPPPPGIDFASETKDVYAFHMLVGHHGVFSLTPIWLLALAGMLMRLPASPMRTLNQLTFLMTLVVIGFYIWKTNNYEGWTSGPRWQFWLIPLFLIALLPMADWLGRTRGGRFFGCLLLGASVFSAVYPVWNPWRHPWIYNLCEYMNWVKY